MGLKVGVGDIKKATRAFSELQVQEQMIKAEKENASIKIYNTWQTYSDSLIIDYMRKLPLDNLSIINKRLPLSVLKDTLIDNIAGVYELSTEELENLPGIGETSAYNIRQAVKTIYTISKEEIKPRLNPDNLSDIEVEIIRSVVQSKKLNEYTEDYDIILNELKPDFEKEKEIIQDKGGLLKWLFTNKQKKEEILSAETRIKEIVYGEKAQKLNLIYMKSLVNTDSKEELIENFVQNNIDYYTMLEKITGFGKTTDPKDLSSSLIKTIEEYPLNLENIDVSLRGYQEFGIKYILHQKKVLLGDEMGLGKTIQALSAINHLYQNDQKYSVVISPLSVVTNWQREIKKFTKMNSYIFHGKTRESAWKAWSKHGGVLITTFEQTKRFNFSEDHRIDICIVDEAHYIKNPDAQRSKAVYKVAEKAEYSVFMSGTPIENRLEEMKQLISILQPEIAETIDPVKHSLQPSQFRKLVAPVYLRRNRKEVLAELPEMEMLERWVDFGDEERENYEKYVEYGHLMGMRRAGWTGGTLEKSPKLAMLVDICEEAKENGYKVLIFSFFKDVIRTIHHEVEDRAFEPITGSVSNVRRQEIIDEFTSSAPGSILISQITAGGVGLNIQAANVVILCEPQWKPSIEQQAISRAYRMGQARDVLVYRILTNDSIDESMLELLGYKSKIFDDYARESDIADQSYLAKDVSDKEMKKKIISKERERLHIPTETAMPLENEVGNEEDLEETDRVLLKW